MKHRSSLPKFLSHAVAPGLGLFAALFALQLGFAPLTAKSASASPDPAASRAAFLKAYQVFTHPRCMNCHPAGDVPLQGENQALHTQGVRRGPKGDGTAALKCSTCHQLANRDGPHLPPGHPNWHLPPAETPMVFQGRTPAQLARQLLDPKQNGGKTPEQIIEHNAHDSLVSSCWLPNTNGRPLPPISQQEFAAAVRTWIEKGASIPE